MTYGLYKNITLGLTLLAITLGVSACGRKGALEAPPSAQIVQDETQPKQETPAKPDNPFFLDPLI